MSKILQGIIENETIQNTSHIQIISVGRFTAVSDLQWRSLSQH